MAKKETATAAAQRETLAVRRFYVLVVCLVMILLLTIGSVVLWIITPWSSSLNEEKSGSLFAVKSVTLEGNTKYHEEAVIGESGIEIGQSIFSVNAKQTEEKLLSLFPYYASVEVQTLHMDQVHIIVSETSVIGAMFADGSWMLVGDNYKVLEQQEVTSDVPRRLLYIKGADAPEGGVTLGGEAMDLYSKTILQTILSAAKRYELNNVIEVDLSDKSDLKLNWNDQILVKLGNATNLEHEIGVVAGTIPMILSERGSHATGVLNVSSYSNDALENQAVFTPSSLIPTTTAATRRPAVGETTTTTTTMADSDDDWYDDAWDDDTWDDTWDDTDTWDDDTWDD